ncbi:MAG: hypothetical protein RR327_05175 [Clostridia bacterium]
MKKTLLVGLLVCAILASVITGTLAVYQANIDEMSGDVVAKRFIMTSNKSDNFEMNLKIAPGETITYNFEVMNYEGDLVTETKMKITTFFFFDNAAKKKSILPLQYTVTELVDGHSQKPDEKLTLPANGDEKFVQFTNNNLTANVKHKLTYKVTITWPKGDNVLDTSFQGHDFGNKFRVKVVGVQIVD